MTLSEEDLEPTILASTHDTVPLPATEGTDEEKFLGQKQRRRSSAHKIWLGDYLNAACIPQIQKLMSKNGDTEIAFADLVIKVNKRNKMQSRILLLTGKDQF